MKRFGWILLVFVAFFFAFQGFLVPDASADGKMFKSAGANLKSECEKLSNDFFFGEFPVNARQYYEIVVRLKHRIFSNEI